MESVFTSSIFQWAHDVTHGRRITPPTEDQLTPLTDNDGNAVISETGAPALVPKPDWKPEVEEVELDTVVIADFDHQGQPTGTIFKFAFDKQYLARFLATYVEHLDTDGRVLLRDALERSSGIVVPEVTLNREQRRKLTLA